MALPDRAVDRIVSNYVFDLMPSREIEATLTEAQRTLSGDGRLYLVSLTKGTTWFSRLVSNGWLRLHLRNSILVGDCRPLELLRFVEASSWRTFHTTNQPLWNDVGDIDFCP